MATPTRKRSKNSRLWSARFAEPVDAITQRFTSSLSFDRRLALQDIDGSVAHARMLAACGVIPAHDRAAIERGLAKVRAEIAAGKFTWLESDEDVHSAIERRLTELAGDAGKRLHTARSRNDQVATDLRLWLRGEIDAIDKLLIALIAALAKQVGSSRVDLQACKLEYSIVSPK